MKIEVAYAKPGEQLLLALDVHEGVTAEDVIRRSGILERFPEIDLEQAKIGIFSKPCKLDYLLKPGDRLEIYRPLIADPKEARRNRAAKKGDNA